MKLLDFIQTRLAFAGFPPGELHSAFAEVAAGQTWRAVFVSRGRTWRKLAMKAGFEKNGITAAQLWRWAACAYHAASFSFHLCPTARGWQTRMSRLRLLARGCYLRSCSFVPAGVAPASLAFGSLTLRGYLRMPERVRGGAVVLVNGLDSIAEVELHAFGNWMLERGLPVLALDLPAGMRLWPRADAPSAAQLSKLARGVADWLSRNTGAHAFGAFGVSFGGYIVARLLAAETRFVAGVAVSPPAFLGPEELSLERLRKMLAWTFALNESQVADTAATVALSDVATPSGKILLFQMEQDELFGSEHTGMFKAWGGPMVEVVRSPGEHVGTSKAHLWLPAACDWLKKALLEEGTA